MGYNAQNKGDPEPGKYLQKAHPLDLGKQILQHIPSVLEN
jgi:hypothetical protein